VSPTLATAPSISWFALRVRSRSEIMVSHLLEAKGYQSYSPSYAIERQYSDRIKRLEAALFPGYVFCRFAPSEILPIVSTPAVQQVVGIGPYPQAISDEEIERIQLGVLHGQGVAPCPYLQTGQRVRVRSGALSGIEGFLVQLRNNHRLVISADILQRAVSLEIDARQVVPV
jgi:transcription termination/antitermination protein NusG